MEKTETLAFLSAHGKDTVERSDSEYRRERRRMIGSVRFLVMLETWDLNISAGIKGQTPSIITGKKEKIRQDASHVQTWC